MLTREQKTEQVADLKDKFDRATSVFVADYRGLTVESVNELRRKLRAGEEDEYEYQVVKNSLLKLAVADSGAESLSELFAGPTAVAFSFTDPVGLAKILVDYAKDNEVFELKGGYLDGNALDEKEVAHLATLPSLQELRGKLVGLLNAPATKLVRLLNEPGGQLARLVKARQESLGE